MTSSRGCGPATRAAAGQTLTFNVDATTVPTTQENLIADTPTGNPERTTVVGAHLDSVEEGPGINDNGSGSGAILEIAEEIAELPRNPRNRIRFAWWGAEEAGLVGSDAYVADLIESGEIDNIEANLNFDMLSSPNFVRFVYDGDNSTGEGDEGPPGSAEIEQVFLDHFESEGLETTPTAFDGRSDYGPFIAPAAYVAAGGLFSGAEGVKTPEEEAIYGGAAGSWYDPCYHQFCDTFSTVIYEPPFVAARIGSGGFGTGAWRKARRRPTPPRCAATARSASASCPTAQPTRPGPWRARAARWSVRLWPAWPVPARNAGATAGRIAVRPRSACTWAVR